MMLMRVASCFQTVAVGGRRSLSFSRTAAGTTTARISWAQQRLYSSNTGNNESSSMISTTSNTNGRSDKFSKEKFYNLNNKSKNRDRNTGGLRRLPVVKPANEIVSKAQKVVYKIQPDRTIKNIRSRARKHGCESIDGLSKALCIPLRDCVDGYRREIRRLHPFERVVCDLSARSRQKRDGLTLLDVLNEMHETRKELLLFSKDWISKIKTSETAQQAKDTHEEAHMAITDLYMNLAQPILSDIIQLQKSLRSTPIIKLGSPAVVLVGAPNVGKSSIVRKISSGNPEVNNYPFTTRGMTLGHVDVCLDYTNNNNNNNSVQCQIMDSPGLLLRSDDDRNEMEQLTLAAMQHLPTAVLYILDLTGAAGDKCSSIDHQLQLRNEVRSRFPKRPWLDVLSKSDLGISQDTQQKLRQTLGDDTLHLNLSIHDGTGVEELETKVITMLSEVQLVLDAMAAVKP